MLGGLGMLSGVCGSPTGRRSGSVGSSSLRPPHSCPGVRKFIFCLACRQNNRAAPRNVPCLWCAFIEARSAAREQKSARTKTFCECAKRRKLIALERPLVVAADELLEHDAAIDIEKHNERRKHAVFGQ